MNKVTIVIVGVLMAICWGLCAGVLTFMKNVNDIADADCIFSHKWICTLTNYTCYVSVVSSFCTMGFLYYLWRRMAAADGKSPFTVLFSVLGALLTILWIVSLAGKTYEWGFAAVDLPFSYYLGTDFGTLYGNAKALLITTHFCILIWIFTTFITFEKSVTRQNLSLTRIILYCFALLAGMLLFDVVVSTGYSEMKIIKLNQSFLTCDFASEIVCRFAAGAGFTASIYYAVMLPLSFIAAKQINKFAIVGDIAIGIVFIVCGIHLSIESGSDNINRQAKIAACAMTFIGFALSTSSAVLDLVKFFRDRGSACSVGSCSLWCKIHCGSSCCCKSQHRVISSAEEGEKNEHEELEEGEQGEQEHLEEGEQGEVEDLEEDCLDNCLGNSLSRPRAETFRESYTVDMIVDSDEYKRVRKRILDSGKFTITSMKKISCTTVRNLYEEEKRNLETRRRREINEGRAFLFFELFHGTKQENAKSIMDEGFKRKYAGSNVGTKYGKGVYFASTAKFAMNYATKDEVSGDRVLLLCEVLIGLCTKGSQDMDMPPAIEGYSRLQGEEHYLYDSTTDGQKYPEIYVSCYKGDHYAVPRYIIRLRQADE
eukprot:m.187448 g.187448  ORF g.187448 m.187448 type:complete len:597 (+) comp39363_c0_seq9:173-1963(+)